MAKPKENLCDDWEVEADKLELEAKTSLYIRRETSKLLTPADIQKGLVLLIIKWANNKVPRKISQSNLDYSLDMKGRTIFKLLSFWAEEVKTMHRIGDNTIINTLIDYAPRKVSSDKKVTLLGSFSKGVPMEIPGNADSVADAGVHRMVLISQRLGSGFITRDQTVSVRRSNQTDTQLCVLYNDLQKVLTWLEAKESRFRGVLPIYLGKDEKMTISVRYFRFIIWRWAQLKSVLPFAKTIIKDGNLTLKEYRSIIATWGTPDEIGNLTEFSFNFLSSVCDCMIHHENFEDIIPQSSFYSFVELRRELLPRFTLIEKGTGKNPKESRQLVKVDVFHPEKMRFLFTQEREKISAQIGPISLIQNKIENIGPYKTSKISSRDYLKFAEITKSLIIKLALNYNTARKNCRLRFKRMKNLQSEEKIFKSVSLEDSFFKSKEQFDLIMDQIVLSKTSGAPEAASLKDLDVLAELDWIEIASSIEFINCINSAEANASAAT